MLNQFELQANLTGLFYSGVDWRAEDLRGCEYAFKNLTLHCVEAAWPDILSLVQFDDIKLELMLRRFYRDAFGVVHFQKTIREICPEEEMRQKILKEMDRLSIRINSPTPRKTRIAAAFSLWMATFRPIYLKEKPEKQVEDLWSLDAFVNFYIATSYLGLYGNIKVGVSAADTIARYQRVYYDFTCRDINLSSLEMLYCSIFEPPVQIAHR